MSRKYIRYCRVHGKLTIVVQKPPIIPPSSLYCPFCSARLAVDQQVMQFGMNSNPTFSGA
jgi:hypothetical protein